MIWSLNGQRNVANVAGIFAFAATMAAVVVDVQPSLAWHENLLWVIYVLSNHVTVYLLEFQPDQEKRYEKNAKGARIAYMSSVSTYTYSRYV